MKAKWSWWKTAILSMMVLGVAFWIVLPLKPFQDCIRERKDYQSYRPLREKPLFLVQRLRIRLNLACAVHAAGAYQDALVGLSGVAIAFFTFTLWISTRKLWASGERQVSISAQLKSITDTQTSIQKELARPHIFVVGIDVANEPGWTIVSVIWRNSGQTPPTSFVTRRQMGEYSMDGLPDDFDYSIEIENPLPIGADMEMKANGVFVPPDTFPRRRGDPNNLFIWGDGRYTDNFSPGVIHHVEFCYRLALRESAVVFLPHGPHNRIYDTNDTNKQA
jgi:hypothetical protein